MILKKMFLFLFIACFTTALFAQTIVSTISANKNVILEEYTGTNCPYCPDGHKVAAQIMANNPGRAYAINIHQGGYSGSNPDYKTQWGNALAQQYSINSYPNGTVNRGASATSDRGQWTTQSNARLAEVSPVNVAAAATIDWNTRVLTVMVEVYYTGNATNQTNKLNVALLQNNVLGPQVGGSSYYPAMVHYGNLYQHMHMFRHLLTEQWGVDIPATTQGTFYTKTFTYEIPEHLRNVPLCLEDLEILAFVCEGNKTILSGCKAALTFENRPAVVGRIEQIEDKFIAGCDGSFSAICIIRNSNDFAVNSIEITYTIAGGATNVYTWSRRTIAAQTWDTIHLPTFMIEPNVNRNLLVTLSKINGENANSSLSKTIKKDITQGDKAMKFILATDRYASETTFKIFNPDETILLQGGPWSNSSTNTITVREFDFNPKMEGCYKVEVYDSHGDGINAGFGAGYVRILNNAGNSIYNNNGKFGSKLTAMVSVDTVVTWHKITASNGQNGTINPTGVKEYMVGGSAKYRFLPNANYEVDEVLINNEPVELEQPNEYTFSNIDKDYTIRVTFKSKVGIKDVNGVHISITPTPVNDKLYVTGMYDKLEIFSTSGQLLTTAFSEPSIDVSRLARGVYFVKIQSNGQVTTFKVVK